MRHFAAPITDRRIRFALVGCGRIAANHFARHRATHAERAELVDVCDIGRGGDGGGRQQPARAAGRTPASMLERRRRPTPSSSPRPAALHREQAIEIAAARPPRHHRKADGDALGRRPAHGQGLRRRPACACSSSSRTAATRRCSCLKRAVERRALRPHLHGHHQRLLDAPAGLLRQRAAGAAPGSSTAAPS